MHFMIKKFATMVLFFIFFLSMIYLQSSYEQNDTVDELYNKGNELFNDGKYDEAITYYDKALEIDPNYVKALSNRGSALSTLERYEEAIMSYDKALEIEPTYVKALINKGIS